MACEKYATWMTDAALGALAPGRESELLAHAAECDACREAYRRARDVAAFVDRGVESLTSGAPSPHFNTRLRARITAEPSPSRFQLPFVAPASSRLFAFAASVLVFAIVLSAVFIRPWHHTDRKPVVPFASANQPSPSRPIASNSSSQTARAEPPHISPVHRPIRPATPHSSQPEVLVQPGQFAAVFQYADAIRSGRINGEQIVAAQQMVDGPLEVTPIEIPLLDAPSDESGDAKPSENSGGL